MSRSQLYKELLANDFKYKTVQCTPVAALRSKHLRNIVRPEIKNMHNNFLDVILRLRS